MAHIANAKIDQQPKADGADEINNENRREIITSSRGREIKQTEKGLSLKQKVIKEKSEKEMPLRNENEEDDVSMLSTPWLTQARNGSDRDNNPEESRLITLDETQTGIMTSTQTGGADQVRELDFEFHKCPYCREHLEDSVECDKCKMWSCIKCQNLNKSELKTIGQSQKINGLIWVCNRCNDSLKRWMEDGENQYKKQILVLEEIIKVKDDIIGAWYNNNETKEKEEDRVERKKEIQNLTGECEYHKQQLHIRTVELLEKENSRKQLTHMVEKLEEINKELIMKIANENAKRKTMQQEEKGETEYEEDESERDTGNEERNSEGEASRDREGEQYKANNSRTHENTTEGEETQEKVKGDMYEKNELCRNNEIGICTRGKRCWYIHRIEKKSMEREYVNRICRFYRKGNCTRGRWCRFLHRREYTQKKHDSEWTNDDKCNYFRNEVACPYATTVQGCRYWCYRDQRPRQDIVTGNEEIANPHTIYHEENEGGANRRNERTEQRTTNRNREMNQNVWKRNEQQMEEQMNFFGQKMNLFEKVMERVIQNQAETPGTNWKHQTVYPYQNPGMSGGTHYQGGMQNHQSVQQSYQQAPPQAMMSMA